MWKHCIAWFLLMAILSVSGCGHKQEIAAGYIESNLHYLASSQAGELKNLLVQRGQHVTQGQTLFQIERQPYLAQYEAALAAVARAKAALQDKLTGERPDELAQIKARIKQAEAQAHYASLDLIRTQKLLRADATTKEALDKAKRDASLSNQEVIRLKKQGAVAEAAARIQEIKAARALLAQAKAQAKTAQWTLKQTTVRAPKSGIVFDRYYHVGEQVPAQHPVVSLRVLGDERIIFYVPGPTAARLAVGDTIRFKAVGKAATGEAVIRFISPQAQYTPPIIYSRQTQHKLIYRVEAAFVPDQHAKPIETTGRWRPGEVVSVLLPPATATRQLGKMHG